MFRLRTVLSAVAGLLVAIVVLAGCSSMQLPGARREPVAVIIHPEYPGREFNVLGLIAGEDSRSGREITSRVRERLEFYGLDVLRHPGVWRDEHEAISTLCGQGVDAMINQLLRYVGPRLDEGSPDTQAGLRRTAPAEERGSHP
jgi:hypothetical protein